ncbi:hypothetical protein ABEF95_012757 [Exophiala dermatitidis]
MRLHEMPSSLSWLVAAILLSQPVSASFLPDLLHSFEDLQNVQKRCESPCGYYGLLCCGAGEVCYTDANNQAQCGTGPATTAAAVGGSGQWQYYTTTYVETDLKTVTQTFSSYIPAIVTNTASAPLRPTSNTLVTVTSQVGSATTTQPFVTPVGTGGSIITGPTSSSSGGLSGGAIAGIVIGVIAGIILLLLLCACLCFKGLIDGLLAIFGLGPRRKRRTVEEEVYVERHHRSGRGGRTGGRTWFGQRPARTEVVEEKRSSGIGKAGWVAATLGGLALFLGLKRRRDRRDDKSSSGYGSSYYYSDYTVSTKAHQIEERGGVAGRGQDDDMTHAWSGDVLLAGILRACILDRQTLTCIGWLSVSRAETMVKHFTCT